MTPIHRMICTVAVSFALFSGPVAAQESAAADLDGTGAEAAAPAEVVPWVVSQGALELIPGRTDLFRGADPIDWRAVEAPSNEILSGAFAGWMNEALAPLLFDAECRRVLEARGMPASPDLAARLVGTTAAGRPAAVPTGGAVVLYDSDVSSASDEAREFLATTGMLPVEAALAAEWGRAVGSRHVGPAPRSALLRAVRAARLEGVARLTAITSIVRGTGVEPIELGSSLIELDRESFGTPKPAGPPVDPVSAAMLEMYFEDGIRWAILHYLAAGPQGVEAALRRPATSPAALVRPGARFEVPAGQPPGCQLGPRGAAALLTGGADQAWLSGLVRDSFKIGQGGRILAWLGFDSPGSAAATVEDLEAAGWTVSPRGAVLIAARPPSGG